MTSPSGIQLLVDRFGQRFTSAKDVLATCGNHETWLAPQLPEAVIYPVDEEEIVAAVNICAAHKMPMIPYGSGTSLEGQVNAPQGGVCVRFDRMNSILQVNERDMVASVQPGTTREQLNAQIKDAGLFFPVDPSPGATFGGMASTRASGTNAVKYGTMAENVLSLRVVLANGEAITTGSRAKKSAVGYDLTKLFVGAEGTLGIITALTVKLWPEEKHEIAGRCGFETLDMACNAVLDLTRSGYRPEKVEIIDELGIQACNAYFGFAYPEVPTLFFQFTGNRQMNQDGVDRFEKISKQNGCIAFEAGTSSEERQRLWSARKDAWWAFRALRPDAMPLSTDVCVPQSKLAECIRQTQQDLAANGLTAPIIGHVGDGNFHALVLIDVNNPHEVRRAKFFAHNLGLRALAMGGTVSGEHGVGQGKSELFAIEKENAVGAMVAIKYGLDPHNIMNPGKLWQASKNSTAAN